MPIVLHRFLVRRASGDVFVWTEYLARRKDLEEVWANDAKDALVKNALPPADGVSLDDLEGMSKTEIMVFCRIRLGLEVDDSMTKATLCDLVREQLWARPGPEEAANMTTRTFKDVSDIRSSGAQGHGGDRATIVGSRVESGVTDKSVR